MKRSDVKAKVKELFEDADSVDVHKSGDKVVIELAAMFEAPGRDLPKLIKLGEFVGTMEIEEAGTYNSPGCDTCDYGSSYGVELAFNEPEGFEWD